MAVTKYALLYDGVQGGNIEIGTFTATLAELAADTQLDEAVTVAGAASGDLVFVSAVDIDAGLVVAGASVTGAAEVTVNIQNTTEAAVTGGATTFQYLLVKISAA